MGNPSKLAATITDNTLSFGSLCKFTFRLRPDGKMEGTRNDSGIQNTTVLTLLSATDFDEKFAAFSGRWVGVWDDNPIATTSLTIESVTPTRDVTGSYVFMSSTPIKFMATIIENTITFGSFPFTFKLRPDGKMEGTRNANGVLNTTVLTRDELPVR
jgi:hypothetical protein